MNSSVKTITGAALLVLIVGVLTIFFDSTSSSSTTPAVTASSLSGDAQEITLGFGRTNYNPEVITVQSGKKVRITGDLMTLNGCFRSVVIPDLGVSKYMKPGDNVLEFTPTKPGTFRLTCSMGMGNGRLVVT